jgi:hypothetical protein
MVMVARNLGRARLELRHAEREPYVIPLRSHPNGLCYDGLSDTLFLADEQLG